MLGKYSSVPEIIEAVREVGVGNYAVTEFVPGEGKKTRRWAVGWSFGAWRPEGEVARGLRSLEKRFLPVGGEVGFRVGGEKWEGLGRVVEGVKGIMRDLGIELEEREGEGGVWVAVGKVAENVWSRAARRRRQQGGASNDIPMEKEEPAMVFKITVGIAVQDSGGTDMEVTIRWIMGTDSVLFESFCGMLRREIG